MSEAARLAPATIAHFQRQIEAARKQCTPVHTAVSQIQFDQARAVATARLERMQALPDRSRAQGKQFLDTGAGKARNGRLAENRALVAFYEEIADGDHWDSWRVALGRSTVAAYEEQHQVRVAPSTSAHAMLSELGAQVEIEHVRRAIHRDEAFYATTPAPSSTDLLTRPNTQTSLGKLLTTFRRDKEGRGKPASARAFVKVERLLLDWFGAERAVTEIARDECRDLFAHLPQVPVGYTRMRAFAGLPLKQVIGLADAMEEPPLRLSEKSCADYAIGAPNTPTFTAQERFVACRLLLHDGFTPEPAEEALLADDDVEATELARIRLLSTRDHTHVVVFEGDRRVVALVRDSAAGGGVTRR